MNLADVPTDKVNALLERSAGLRAGSPSDVAKGRLLGLLFLNPSLRTRTSMIGAWGYLGGTSAILSPGDGVWELATGDGPMLSTSAEHIEEAAGVLGRLCDVLGVRAFAGGDNWEQDRKDSLMASFAEFADAPLINMESGMYHPCQALADWLTLEDHKVERNAKIVLSWAYHPKALQQAVPNSALLMAAQRGMQVSVLRPDGFALDSGVMEQAHKLAEASGGQISETDDPATLADAQVVQAKSWGSLEHYSDQEASTKLREKYRDWCVGNDKLPVPDSAKFMHCLPVRRDVVATRSIIKSKNSVVLDQAVNRKWAQASILEAMARGV